jgi:hypothetical protein
MPLPGRRGPNRREWIGFDSQLYGHPELQAVKNQKPGTKEGDLWVDRLSEAAFVILSTWNDARRHFSSKEC